MMNLLEYLHKNRAQLVYKKMLKEYLSECTRCHDIFEDERTGFNNAYYFVTEWLKKFDIKKMSVQITHENTLHFHMKFTKGVSCFLEIYIGGHYTFSGVVVVIHKSTFFQYKTLYSKSYEGNRMICELKDILNIFDDISEWVPEA